MLQRNSGGAAALKRFAWSGRSVSQRSGTRLPLVARNNAVAQSRGICSAGLTLTEPRTKAKTTATGRTTMRMLSSPTMPSELEKYGVSESRAKGRSSELVMNDCIMGSGNLTSLAHFVLENVKEFKPINTATSFAQLAKKYKHAGKRYRTDDSVQLSFVTLEEKMLSDMASFGARPFASALWAMAAVRHPPSEEFWQAVDKFLLSSLDIFNSVDLSNTLTAIAKLDHKPSPKALQEIESCVWSQCTKLRNQEITSILWSFAKLGHVPSQGLLGALEVEILKKIPDFWSQNISISLYSFAKLGHTPSEEVLQAADSAMLAKLSFFTPQNLANTLWAFAKFNYQPTEKLMIAVDMQLSIDMRSCDRRALANISWALSELKFEPSARFISAIRVEVRDRGDKLDKATLGLIYLLLPQLVLN